MELSAKQVRANPTVNPDARAHALILGEHLVAAPVTFNGRPHRRRARMAPVDVVQRQLDAYNARDLERFAATYSDSVQIFRLPATEPMISNKRELVDLYSMRVFNNPGLHAEILNRIVLGNKVIDHERVSGLRGDAFESVAVYEVTDGLIQRVWFFNPT
jgi:hypothetical protein